MHAILVRLSATLPAPLRHLATDQRLVVLAEFIRFGLVGLLGFVCDLSVVYTLRGFIGLIAAGLIAYPVAATLTWALNRAWTFRNRQGGTAAPARQWALFLAANSLGFLLNRGTYVVLVSTVELCAQQPVLAVFAGMLAGMFSNFTLSRTLVFRA